MRVVVCPHPGLSSDKLILLYASLYKETTSPASLEGGFGADVKGAITSVTSKSSTTIIEVSTAAPITSIVIVYIPASSKFNTAVSPIFAETEGACKAIRPSDVTSKLTAKSAETVTVTCLDMAESFSIVYSTLAGA